MKNTLTLCLLLTCFTLSAQTNVRAWYADGQVWVVWKAEFPLPDWYSVYAKPSAFSNTTEALRIGKLYKFEYSCAALKEQLALGATARIPTPGGGVYQLDTLEALFVFTPHQAGALFFAVAADDDTEVVAGQSITNNAVPFQYNPIQDPVECHLQASFPSPFAAGFNCFAFMMWSDGRQNQWENRPDFPVTANFAKNGMPHLFFVSAPAGLDTTQPFPMSVWLHGGGGTARQSLPGSRAEIDIRPEKGILLAHDDKMMGYRGSIPPNLEEPTWHFGWRKNYDPFTPDNIPVNVDTIVNYTQRRYLWIDSWLIRQFNVDPHRIHLYGHSMGSAGATALAKCYPEHYASVNIFNNGFGGPDPGTNVTVFGEAAQNYPTNLQNIQGETVRLLNLFNLIDNCSESRDLPLFRHWHGKNDDNGTMRWDAYVVENYRKADSLGIGIQHMWSERGHGVDTGPDYNDHWVNGVTPTSQTVLDNVAYNEARYRSNQSFPAFFNHQWDMQNNDPGVGTLGINNGDGDNWGAWGGWHRWDTETILDLPQEWAVDVWLESDAVFGNDNCPYDSLTASMAIRRPQQFHLQPGTGNSCYAYITDLNSGNIISSGGFFVPDDLAVVHNVTAYRKDIRKIRVHVLGGTSTSEPNGTATLMAFPNPASSQLQLRYHTTRNESVLIRISRVDGGVSEVSIFEAQAGENQWVMTTQDYPNGWYFLSIHGTAGVLTQKVLIQH